MRWTEMERGLKIESYREAFGRALLELGAKNDRVVVLDADVADSTRTALFAKHFPERFVSVGVSEQDLVGMAAGFAISSWLPVASTLSIFLLRAWEQVRNTVARDRLNIKFVATHAGLSDFADGSSHQSVEDIALMRTVPNMSVVVPADAASTRSLLIQATETSGPFHIRIGKDYAPTVYVDDEPSIGKAFCLREGEDVTLVACGVMVSFALEAAKHLQKKGVDAGVLDVHTIKPLDTGAIIKAAQTTGRIVTLEEHSKIGGLGGAVSEILCENHPAPVKRIGTEDCFGRSSRRYLPLLEHLGLGVSNIVAAAEELASGT